MFFYRAQIPSLNEAESEGKLEDLQGIRVFRVQEIPVTNVWAALVIAHWAGEEAALGGIGDRH